MYKSFGHLFFYDDNLELTSGQQPFVNFAHDKKFDRRNY